VKRLVVLIALAALGAAGCASSSTSTVTTTRTVTAPAATSTATTGTASTGATTAGTTTTSTTTTGTTTAGTANARSCRAADLSPSYLGQQGATGHGELGFELRNKSGASCNTFGYPGVLFLDGSGRALPTRTTRTTRDFFGNTTLRHLRVAPSAIVSFRVGVTHEPTAGHRCTTARQVQVIAPNDTARMRVRIRQGGAYECAVATVSPVQAGRFAYP
jgi:uncharacterized protein DUF4232